MPGAGKAQFAFLDVGHQVKGRRQGGLIRSLQNGVQAAIDFRQEFSRVGRHGH